MHFLIKIKDHFTLVTGLYMETHGNIDIYSFFY